MRELGIRDGLVRVCQQLTTPSLDKVRGSGSVRFGPGRDFLLANS
jgi:hypothetical protein